MDYKAMYFHLFNATTDAIEQIDCKFPLVARDLLVEAQRETEEMYLLAESEELDEIDAGLTPEERLELDFHKRLTP